MFLQIYKKNYNTTLQQRAKNLLKISIFGHRRYTDFDYIKETLNCRGLNLIKVLQMKSERDERLLPLFLIDLLKKEISLEIFSIKSLF